MFAAAFYAVWILYCHQQLLTEEADNVAVMLRVLSACNLLYCLSAKCSVGFLDSTLLDPRRHCHSTDFEFTSSHEYWTPKKEDT